VRERGEILMSNDNRVVVTDVSMPFVSMVVFMIKWALASIPAALTLGLVWFMAAAVFAKLGSAGP
jgi:hypothetical protein